MAQSNRQQWWVLAVAVLVGIGGVLYGYDIGVISGALLFMHQAIPMTDAQTSVIVGAVLGGGLLGTLLAGPLADHYGRRAMIAMSSLVFIVGVFCILSADTFATLLLARVLLGIGIGIVAVAVPLYVAELVPKKHRGKYVTFFQLFLTFGIVLAYCIDLVFTPTGNWHAMFAVVLVPAVILLIGVLFLPETPRWLLAKGYVMRARRVLALIYAPKKVDAELSSIQASLQRSAGRWSDLLSAKLYWPLCIAVGVAILNQGTGINAFLQYAPHLLKQAGLGSNVTVMLGSAGIGVMNFVCTIISIFLVDRIGRKPLLSIGVSGVLLSEIFLGGIHYWHLAPHMLGILSLVGLLGFIVFYAIGPGVVVWLVISELFPTRLRGKGIAICLFCNSLAGTVLASTFLDLINMIGIAGTYWLCAGFSLLYWFLAVYALPETKARSLEDIQAHFEARSEAAKQRVLSLDT